MLKNKQLSFLLFGCLSLLMSLFVWREATAVPLESKLTVSITGLRSNLGSVRWVIFNSEQAYNDRAHAAQVAFDKGSVPIMNQQATYTVTLPYGTYAIKVFHDEDNSGQIKKNFFGVPQEEFGFSNNPKVKNAMPSFDMTKFVVNQPKITININLTSMQ